MQAWEIRKKMFVKEVVSISFEYFKVHVTNWNFEIDEITTLEIVSTLRDLNQQL